MPGRALATIDDPEILMGRKYVYSVREGDNRIATFELVRNGHARPALGQIRGNCNAHVPKEITEAVRRWVRVQKWDEAAHRRHTGETLAPPDDGLDVFEYGWAP